MNHESWVHFNSRIDLTHGQALIESPLHRLQHNNVLVIFLSTKIMMFILIRVFHWPLKSIRIV